VGLLLRVPSRATAQIPPQITARRAGVVPWHGARREARRWCNRTTGFVRLHNSWSRAPRKSFGPVYEGRGPAQTGPFAAGMEARRRGVAGGAGGREASNMDAAGSGRRLSPPPQPQTPGQNAAAGSAGSDHSLCQPGDVPRPCVRGPVGPRAALHGLGSVDRSSSGWAAYVGGSGWGGISTGFRGFSRDRKY